MKKSLVRLLYLLGLVVEIIGGVLLGMGLAGSQTVTNGYTTTATSLGNPTLFTIGTILLVIGGIVILVALVGALIRMAQLGRWGWFVCLIVFSGITLLIYVFAGPETPPNQAQVGGQYNAPLR